MERNDKLKIKQERGIEAVGKGFNFLLGKQEGPYHYMDKGANLKEVTERAMLICGERQTAIEEGAYLVWAAKRSVWLKRN